MFGDFSFSRFGFIAQTNRHTHKIKDAAKRFTPATVVGVSNYACRPVKIRMTMF